jgi:hypothetical protein
MRQASCLSLFIFFGDRLEAGSTLFDSVLLHPVSGVRRKRAGQDFKEAETLKYCQQKFNSSLPGSLVVQSASSASSADG